MRFLLSILLFSCTFAYADAHIPTLIEQESIHDITNVTDPELSQAFYGRLTGDPHTYEIRSTAPFELDVQVLLPDIEGVSTDLSGIIIRETGFRGQVREVARLLGKDASWESFYEPWGGDRYRRGSEYTAQVEAGVYRVEVSTPQNETPYVLVIGKREGSGSVGYFEMVKRIAAVKAFYGKSRLMVIQSPFVYGPVGLLLIVALLWYLHRRRLAE